MAVQKPPAFWKQHLKELGLKRKPASRRGHESGGAPSKVRRGQEGELLAVDFLLQQGFSILERNVRTREFELDIVAQKAGLLVFVEVKLRKNSSFGVPAEAVGPRKAARIRNGALVWLASHPARTPREIRFDVIAIQEDKNEIDWIQGAFDAH